jgi:hypothetical protein
MMKNNRIQICVRLNPDLLNDINKYCMDSGCNRNKLIERLLLEGLAFNKLTKQ